MMILGLLGCGVKAPPAPAVKALSYEDEVQAWKAERKESLLDPTGWFSVSGLFWLNEDRTTLGSHPKNDIDLPRSAAPIRVGVFLAQQMPRYGDCYVFM